jgi:drug/metabolite transporter (DMT)-like permease
MSAYRYLLLLHLVVLIFGFTGVLGKLVSVDALLMVWYRMGIAALGIAALLLVLRRWRPTPGPLVVKYLLTGFLIAAHWSTFFGSIKASTVSIALVCVSCGAAFTALLEPWFFKRRVRILELGLAGSVIIGMGLVFRFETEYAVGIALGVSSAFLAALFSVINAGFIKHDSSTRIAFWEMLGGVLGVSLVLLATGRFDTSMLHLSGTDVVWLLVLGLVCTAFAFVAVTEVMRELTPFTVNLSINLEPVYGIAMALLIFGDEERLSGPAYLGMAMILLAVFLETWLKRRQRRQVPVNPA